MFSAGRFFSKYFLTIMAGFILGLAFAMPLISPIAWLAPALFFYALYLALNHAWLMQKSRRHCARRGAAYSFFFSMSFYLTLLIWLFSLHPIAGMEPWQSIVTLTFGWLLFSLVMTLFLTIAGYLLGFLSCNKNKAWTIALTVSLWVMAEWLQSLGPSGFTWGRLSVSQYACPVFLQSTAVWGSLGLSGLMIAVSSLLAVAVISYRNGDKWQKIAIMAFILFAANLLGGLFILGQPEETSAVLKAAIIQNNNPSGEKWQEISASNGGKLDVYRKLTQKAVTGRNLDLIIWPETALPYTITKGSTIAGEYQGIAAMSGCDFLVGGFAQHDNKIYNSIFVFSPDSNYKEAYAKRHLVPFGEYIPLRKILSQVFPSLENLKAQPTDLTPGKDGGFFRAGNTALAALICYESIFPALLHDSIEEGGKAIIVLTNDSWFWGSPALRQHLAQAVLRSVEYNRYTLRAANAGYSAVISNHGLIKKITEPQQACFLQEDIPLLENMTIYAYFGDTPLLIISALVILWTVIAIRKN